MFFVISLAVLGLLMLATLYNAIFRSKDTFLKIQSINTFTSLAIMFISILVYLLKEPGFIDLAIIYVVLNYIGIATVIKYITFAYNKNNN